MGDADGIVHLVSDVPNDELPFNGFEGQAVEWPDPEEPLEELEWTDST